MRNAYNQRHITRDKRYDLCTANVAFAWIQHAHIPFSNAQFNDERKSIFL